MKRTLLFSLLVIGSSMGTFPVLFTPPACVADPQPLYSYEAEIFNRADDSKHTDNLQAHDVVEAQKLLQGRYPGKEINFLHKVGD